MINMLLFIGLPLQVEGLPIIRLSPSSFLLDTLLPSSKREQQSIASREFQSSIWENHKAASYVLIVHNRISSKSCLKPRIQRVLPTVQLLMEKRAEQAA
ncbi:hypothetical protein HOY82DRAFT_196064 [Tuber indicum]|nr:hypothetical protein HOY82DRAFT_196064 [Tuber indicum]